MSTCAAIFMAANGMQSIFILFSMEKIDKISLFRVNDVANNIMAFG